MEASRLSTSPAVISLSPTRSTTAFLRAVSAALELGPELLLVARAMPAIAMQNAKVVCTGRLRMTAPR
jgi:hypothetical protein